jgi:hypothetical protein
MENPFMRRGWLIVLVAAVVCSALGNLAMSKLNASRKLRHIVLYQFKDSATEAQIQEVVEAFSALPKQVPSVIGFERGTNVSREGKSDGLTHAFVVTFRDEAGRDEYLTHPAHQKYVELVRDRREKVVVFDYWADE